MLAHARAPLRVQGALIARALGEARRRQRATFEDRLRAQLGQLYLTVIAKAWRWLGTEEARPYLRLSASFTRWRASRHRPMPTSASGRCLIGCPSSRRGSSPTGFGCEGRENLGLRTAAEVNAARMPGARTKAFNTLTAGFQAQAAGRTGPDRVVMFVCGDDEDAKRVVAGLIDDAGFTPVHMGGTADAGPMEAPRRPGAVYGEEYHEAEARAFVDGLR